MGKHCRFVPLTIWAKPKCSRHSIFAVSHRVVKPEIRPAKPGVSGRRIDKLFSRKKFDLSNYEELVRALRNFEWTDDRFVEAFEKYVSARVTDGRVLINSEIGWIPFPVPGDYFGESVWWTSQLSQADATCKSRFAAIARANMKGDEFDAFLIDVAGMDK